MPKQANKYSNPRRSGPKRAKLVKTECHEANRGTACARGYNRKWRTARLIYLADNPLCVLCEEHGNGPTEATVVDHIQDHKGNSTLFWDVTNWQALCEACHNHKTGKTT